MSWLQDTVHEDRVITWIEFPKKKQNKTHTTLHMSYVGVHACKYYMAVTCLTHSGSVSLFEL